MTTPAEALERVRALIEESEKVGSVLSLRPTPFQLEQASGFNTVTVPKVLRDLQAHIERLERERDETFQNQDHRIEAYARDLQAAEAKLVRYEEALPKEIGEDTYLYLPKDLQRLYGAIHEDETPTLERCFRLRALDFDDGPDHRGDDLCRFEWKEHA